jgi:hypothetical protein
MKLRVRGAETVRPRGAAARARPVESSTTASWYLRVLSRMSNVFAEHRLTLRQLTHGAFGDSYSLTSFRTHMFPWRKMYTVAI